ncbi:PKD domain-containing protein [Ekhidna sp.]|uniref:alpha/beta hydrolase n=1 Tax=Ekhidna sp. TaxID=2608089 RepID=UPI003299C27C
MKPDYSFTSRIISSLVLSAILMFFIGCSGDGPSPVELSAAFAASATSSEIGQSITYTDQSTGNPVSWNWTFEGGDPATSTEQNPTVTYPSVGTFDVSLTVSNQTTKDDLTKADYVTIIQTITADFSFSATTVLEGESIQYNDESTGDPTEWNWAFEGGDPATSTEQNPEVTYNKAGVYSVTLTSSNSSDDQTIVEERLISVTCTGIYCEPIFSTYKKTNLVYGVDPEGHQMIVYEPSDDSRTDRPVVAIMGGGAFEGTNLDLMEPLAINLVNHGAIVALLAYRVIDTEDGTTELVNAQQDCRTAVRYLRKEAINLGINPEHIFIGGNGSGAFAALFHAYVDESDFSSAELDIINGLGGLEGENQGNTGFNSEVSGIVSLAGGMYNTLDPVTNQDVPIYAIHGTSDTEVPYDSKATTPITYGSKSIVDKVNSVGLKGQLYTIEGGSHSAPRERSDDYILELMYFIRDIVE